jgi:mRNA interferase RelE/StbE
MSKYQITFARSARHELERLPINTAIRILKKIENLADEPRPHGCKKLQGPIQLWRIRVGEYRVVYKIEDKNQVIDISVIRHRSEAYR